MAGADFLAALLANYFLGAFAPVDFLAVYFVLAIFNYIIVVNFCLNRSIKNLINLIG